METSGAHGYFAFLIPTGEYVIDYYFPVNESFGSAILKHQIVFSKEFYAAPGKVIYLGKYEQVIEHESDNSTYTAHYIRMDVINNYEEDINRLKKKYPEVFTDLKFTAENLAIGP